MPNEESKNDTPQKGSKTKLLNNNKAGDDKKNCEKKKIVPSVLNPTDMEVGKQPRVSQTKIDRVETMEKLNSNEKVELGKSATKTNKSRSRTKATHMKKSRHNKKLSKEQLTGRGQHTKFVEPLGNTVYQFIMKDLNGDDVPLKCYQGFPVLIVNIASQDMLLSTKNFVLLNRLYLNYTQYGFQIAAFPSNEFGCEPLSDKEYGDFIKKQEIKYHVYSKIDLSGPNASPLFAWLKQLKSGLFYDAIKYNFTKFLIDRHGVPFKRYSPLADTDSIEPDIKALLS